MIGPIAGVAFFLGVSYWLTGKFKAYYRKKQSYYSTREVYVEFVAAIIITAMTSIIVGQVVAESAYVLLVPVICYGLYRASRWWFDKKIAND